MNISFDIHDTILISRFGNRLSRIQFFRNIFYFLSNFRLFIFIYTFFCKRNENIIKEMIKSKQEGNNIIILTSTNKKSKKIIFYFLNKNKIIGLFDTIIFRENFFQSETSFKLQEIIKNNIDIHYDDSVKVYKAINKIKNKKCTLIKK